MSETATFPLPSVLSRHLDAIAGPFDRLVMSYVGMLEMMVATRLQVEVRAVRTRHPKGRALLVRATVIYLIRATQEWPKEQCLALYGVKPQRYTEYEQLLMEARDDDAGFDDWLDMIEGSIVARCPGLPGLPGGPVGGGCP